ncbi:polyamine ABC transporter substrate-binding protein [Flexivirga oryzae]|uniref:Spermidine/putrescine transport system substrate-binding protein n=1 Tax=Flexivirga oryzae TaxID=1794944 RepID=A0A839NAC4_9MICO|nr:spermidine/putrescine ABC transporter substrate-binding protein [Flexivirga oryzae]MBB2893779.1 spermidine/putrescine transport system substrate-binding protein [Flexivirga oryzae]
MTPVDPTPSGMAQLRGLTQRRFSRRDLLQAAGLLAGAGLIAGCSVPGARASVIPEGYWDDKKPSKYLDWANWPLYLDVGKENGRTVHPSLVEFTKKTGIKVKYEEVIQDMDSFVGTIRPVLASHQATGYDLMVLTNGIYLTQMKELNYLVPLDHSRMPNFFKYADSTSKNPTYDPGNKYTVPWQSGITGMAYNPKYVKRPITSFDDLFDPAFKGKVGMFADNQDLPNFALVGIGVDPAKSTEADWRRAAERLKQQRDQGLVRAYYQQDYISPLSKGDLWVTMAWSGDIFQANASTPGLDLKFVVPKQGAVVWTDNLCIPRYSNNPVSAMELINFMYQPEIAAMVAEYVNYFTPVPDAKKYILADAKAATKKADREELLEIAESPLVFPTKAMESKLYRYATLKPEEVPVWNQIFEPVYES